MGFIAGDDNIGGTVHGAFEHSIVGRIGQDNFKVGDRANYLGEILELVPDFAGIGGRISQLRDQLLFKLVKKILGGEKNQGRVFKEAQDAPTDTRRDEQS